MSTKNWLVLGAIGAAALLLLAGGVAVAASSSTDSSGSGGGGSSTNNKSGSGGDQTVEDTTIAGTTVHRTEDGFLWTKGLAVDADGAPNAYGPSSNPGLDAIGNAKNSKGWVGIVTDDGTPTGNPITNDQGFYVSPTSLQDTSKNSTDQTRYVDASTVPFLALGRDVLTAMGAALGDLAYAVNLDNGNASPAIVADIAPKGHMHEGSVALAVALLGNIDTNDFAALQKLTRSGGVDDSQGSIAYLVWPGSSLGWPADFEAEATSKFSAWGGVDRVKQIVGG